VRAADAGGLDAAAPWPAMRHDVRNTGASPLPGRDPGGRPWAFRTQRGIFATPAVAADGTVYIGSADDVLYALAPEGTERWRFTTDGIIDTAPALLPDEPGVGPTLVVGSGDETMYRLRVDPALGEGARSVWTFRPTLDLAGEQLVAWWEGSPTVGPDGTVYQGNTGGGAYAVRPDGSQRWAHATGNAVWTVPAIGPDGTTYWGSLDLVVRAVDSGGEELWRRTTLGFVASSPALSTDGTLFVGSFDGRLYALDARSGDVRWSVATGDHVYSSPALVEDQDGRLQLVVVGSTDGVLYGIRPDGGVAWSYDTGAPIRSSPALGRTPDGTGRIAYVGSSDGRLYALDAASGSLRWAFDTTPEDPRLAVYNQLNGSPALGPRGVYVGGQSGDLWYVPYDYCLRAAADPRCGAPTLPDDVVAVVPVGVGGTVVPAGTEPTVTPTGTVVARLLVREGGQTLPAAMVAVPDARALVTVEPAVDVDVDRSGDGRYLVIRPRTGFTPGTTYRVTLAGLMTTDGLRLANVTVGAPDPEPFRGSFTVRAVAGTAPWPLAVGADQVTAVELARLAVPLPPMLNSVNQIGFDFYDWVAGTVVTGPDRSVLWVVGARRDAQGRLVADPSAGFAFPLSGARQGSAFRWSAPGVVLTFTFGAVPMEAFDLAGRFDADGVVSPDATTYARVDCGAVAGYEALLPLTGMCNPTGTIPVAGSFLGEVVDSPAAQRPAGVSATQVGARRDGDRVTFSAGLALATGLRYPARDHAVHLLLLDGATGEPVPLDYAAATAVEVSAAGDVSGVTLRSDRADLPDRVDVVVMTDVFPLARASVQVP
jgi:outer membrane protein assembly factor BamB